MKIWKGILIVLFFTVVSLFYIHQQVDITIAGYKYQRNKVRLNYLFDKNKYLKYNVNKLNSPSHLFAALNKHEERDFKLASNFKVRKVNIYRSPLQNLNGKKVKRSFSLLSYILRFGSKAEAEILEDKK